MNILIHLIVNSLAAIPLKYYLGWDLRAVLIFVLAGILIDLDHLFYFFVKYKTIKLYQLITIGKELRKRMKPGIYIFHSFEFNIILIMASVFHHIIAIVLLSNAIHIILDIIEHYHYHRNFLWIKKWSMIYSFTR